MNIGVFAGSYDPIHLGHIDLITRSLKFCDKLIIGLGINPSKKCLFDEEERLSMIKESLSEFLFPNELIKVEVLIFKKLLVDFAHEHNANLIIRGVRTNSDYEYEANLASINKALSTVETVLLITNPLYSIFSSSAIKEIAKYGGNIGKFTPECVSKKMKDKFNSPFLL